MWTCTVKMEKSNKLILFSGLLGLGALSLFLLQKSKKPSIKINILVNDVEVIPAKATVGDLVKFSWTSENYPEGSYVIFTIYVNGAVTGESQEEPNGSLLQVIPDMPELPVLMEVEAYLYSPDGEELAYVGEIPLTVM